MNEGVNKKIVLLITTLSSFLAPFMGSSVFIGLPSIGKEFAMDAVTLSWVSTSYILAAAMFLVPFGRIADIYGRKKIFKCGIIIDIIASLLLAFSFNETEFIILRFLQGIGAAMIFGTGIAILTSVYLPGERGKALGITVAGVYSGLSLGPVVSGFLVQHFGWRSIFLSYLPFELIIIVLILVGFGFALFSSPNTNAVMSSVEKRFYGIASATLGTMRLVGQMLSMGIAMIIFAVFIGRVEITPEYYISFLKSMNTAFIIFSALCFAGVFVSLARGKVM
jgi:MFS family permease